MSHFAKIVNGIVETVIVADNQEWCEENLGGTWIQTSYNTFGNQHLLGGIPLHKNYAGIGYSWDGIGFTAPQPFPSWTKNKETYVWEAPVKLPNDGKEYSWNEDNQEWVEITPPTE
jgi:hypothetical protein